MGLEEDLVKIMGSDQMGAAYRTLAHAWSIYFKTLQSQGLTREEALALTVAASSAMFTQTFRKFPPGHEEAQ